MKEKNQYWIIVGLLTITFGVLAGMIVASRIITAPQSTQSEVRVLKLAHGLDVSHPVHLGMVHLKEVLEDLSGGRMKLEIYPGGQLGDEREILEQMQIGAIAMGKTSAAPMENFCPLFGVYSLPYLFRDQDHYWRVLEGEVGKRLLNATNDETVGLKGLCYYDAGARSFYTTDGMIKTPADLVGKKIRVMNSKTAMEMIEAMGGSPTPMSWGELYTSLQQGLVDGAENNPPSFYTSRHCEVCKYFSLNEHTRVPDMLLISKKVWDSLSPTEQQWLQTAADESSRFQRDLWQQKTKEALEAVQAMKVPVEVYHPDPKPFRDAVQPIYDALEGTEMGDLVNEIQND